MRSQPAPGPPGAGCWRRIRTGEARLRTAPAEDDENRIRHRSPPVGFRRKPARFPMEGPAHITLLHPHPPPLLTHMPHRLGGMLLDAVQRQASLLIHAQLDARLSLDPLGDFHRSLETRDPAATFAKTSASRIGASRPVCCWAFATRLRAEASSITRNAER